MSYAESLQGLNTPQQQAVLSSSKYIRVFAGAGSGKTRVLVHRIAELLRSHRALPQEILAVTFTNKAANEMRHRVEALLYRPLLGMWVGTFHGLAHRLLRLHFTEAQLPEGFQILDQEDQLRLIRRLQKSLGLDEERYPPKSFQKWINQKKEQGLRARHLDPTQEEEKLVEVYQVYEETCQRSGVVDFTELLLRSHELLRHQPTLLRHYQQQFKHILVDEFQDTNNLQYAWIQLLAGSEGHLFIVGDDDQSIYSWRGAEFENIQRFSRDFSPVETIRLEQNYRSTQTILSAANAMIANNQHRAGKNLWTQDNPGEAITLYDAFNELDEAQFVCHQIETWISYGHRRRDIAVLYRANAQSRVIEEALNRAQIPYQIYGGLKFFERAEIKDVLAYLRLVTNCQDDNAFERIVNTPARGIGHSTVDRLRMEAKERQDSLWNCSERLLSQNALPNRAAVALTSFMNLIQELAEQVRELPLTEQVTQTLLASGLLAFYREDRTEKGLSRIENVEELVSATRQFNSHAKDGPILHEFLAYTSLESGESDSAAPDDSVQLMTLHSAKGLEFELVFLIGLEEGLFPHYLSIDSPAHLEEERRLCYVGMTRAKKKLILSYAESRRLHGKSNYNRPSRFLGEIPQHLLDRVRISASVPTPHTVTHSFPSEVAGTPFSLGQSVRHSKFGRGIILNWEGQGSHARIQVNFEDHGSKWLVYEFAKLEPLF